MSALGIAMAVQTAVDINSRNGQLLSAAADFGRKEAGIEFNRDRQQAALRKEMLTIKQNTTLAKTYADEQAAVALSEAQLQKAYSGVLGTATDVVEADLKRSKEKMDARLDKEEQMSLDQVAQNFVDIGLGADFAKGDFKAHKGNLFADILSLGASYMEGERTKRTSIS